LSDFNDTESSRHIFEKYLNIKIHQNPSSDNRVIPCGQTDMTKLIADFGNFENSPKNCPKYLKLLQALTHFEQWRSCLKHCATSTKVAGSIHDGVIGIFHWHDPSGRTPKEMSNRNIPWGYRRPVSRAENPTNCLEIWEPQIPGILRACPGLDCFTITYLDGVWAGVTVETFTNRSWLLSVTIVISVELPFQIFFNSQREHWVYS
jgi:hypothetical protein